MNIIKNKNFAKAIIFTKILENGNVLVVDERTTIRILEKESLEVIDGFKANIYHLRYKNSVVAFSDNANFFATLSSNCKESKLYNTKTKKIITKVDKHYGEVSCVGIDNIGKYMFSCGEDGKTYAIDIKSGKLAFTLPVHLDTINDIAFSSNGNWIATCSYDGKIFIFHLTMMTLKHKLASNTAPVMKITFIDQDKLFSIDINNIGIIWNIYTGKIIVRLEGIHDDITQVLAVENNKFLFLGTKLGYILVYDLKTYLQVSRKYLKLESSISSLSFDKESKHLIVSCKDGNLLVYNIYDGEEHIQNLIKEKKYDCIYFFIKTNPLLKYTKSDILVSKIWENTLKKAKICLQNGDKETAIALFYYFKNIPEKNKIMNHVLTEYREYNKFEDLVKQEKVALAYGLVKIHPLYMETAAYKSLESRWNRAFKVAQKHIINPKGTEKAREVLAPYRGISDKTKLMQKLFSQGEVYKRFKVSLGQKDFKIAFELIKLHPFLKEFPEYNTIMKYGDILYIKSQKLVNAGDTHSAIKILRILINFPDFTEEVKKLTQDIEIKQKFFHFIQEKDIVNAYNMLDLSDDLQVTKDGKNLQDKWNKDLIKANVFAINGNAEEIKSILDGYMSISSKYMLLGTIFGLCYISQIEFAIKAKKEQIFIENGIKNYILCFGLQNQILSLFEIFISKYTTSKLNLNLLNKGNLSMWRPSMIVHSILD